MLEIRAARREAAVYSQGPVVLLVWRHDGRLTRKLAVSIAGRPISKPYLGARVFEDTAAVVALSDEPPQGVRTTLAITDEQGKEIFHSSSVPIHPLSALAGELHDATAVQKLLRRVLKHAPATIPGWGDKQQRWLTALLTPGSPPLDPPKPTQHRQGQPAQGLASRGLHAAIDAVDGRRVTGWAFDAEWPERPLVLEFFVNGMLAGSTVADNPRTDLRPAAMHPNHGFQVNLRRDTFGSPWRDVHRLDMYDATSGEVLIKGVPIRYRKDRAERDHAGLMGQLERLERAIIEIRGQLPAVRRGSAYALIDYDLWFADVHLPTLATSVRPRAETATPPRISVFAPLTAGCSLALCKRVLDSLLMQRSNLDRVVVLNFGQSDQAYELLIKQYRSHVAGLRLVDARGRAVPALLQLACETAEHGYCLFLQPGEALAPGALTCMADAAQATSAKVFYADGDRADLSGRHHDPVLRPDFNYDLLLSTPYIGAFGIDAGLLQRLAVKISDAPDGVWQYDLLLRATESLNPTDWLHVTRVLTHQYPVAQHRTITDDQVHVLSVLREYFVRRGLPAEADLDNDIFESNKEIPRTPHTAVARIRWRIPNPAPKVSIIIPTHDRADLVVSCIESIKQHTNYPDYEILLVDHDSTDPKAIETFASVCHGHNARLLKYSGEFNWSAINNYAASHAGGKLLCFLNNDTVVIAPDWLTEMIGHACRPDVGAVGAKLLFVDGTLQHGGIILGVHGVAEHAFTGLAADRAGYMMRARLVQNLSAVTGACMVCRREVFEEVGGFELANLGVAFNDVDFCLRLDALGYRTVWTPHALLYHSASQTRGSDHTADKFRRLTEEIAYMQRHWPAKLERDPNFNPAFERHDHPYASLGCATYAAFDLAAKDSAAPTAEKPA